MILPALILLAFFQTPSIDPPANTKPILTVAGVGVQIYTCKAQTGWTFVAPRATLTSAKGQSLGTHSAGPTWTLTDGSSVKGKVLAQRSSPDENSIPWLLLQSTETKGTLVPVTYIQRTETKGGKAPTTGCDQDHLNTQIEIPYQARYTFYSTTP